MRKGWEYKRWKEVLTIINGKNQSAVVDENGEYPIYGSGGIMGYANNWLCPENCVIIGRKGNINKPIFVETKFWNVDTAFGLNANKEYLLPKFLYYFCLDYNFERHNKAVTIPSLTKADLLKIDIPLPPLSTQLAIVSELDKINELIRLKKEQLKDFDNLAQSLFYEMFGDPVENEKGWEAKKLGEIGEFKNGLNFSKDENGHSIKFLGVSDFQNKKSIASDQLDCISLSECVQEDYLLKTGDIVFVRSNGKKELIGRSVKMYITEPTTYSGFCIRCRITDEKVDKDYIAILLKTPIIRQFMTNSGRGCNISNLNQKVLNSIPTILPPLPLQRLFAQRIEQIEREKSEVQKSIQDLETLLASRMQYWFE